MHTATASRAVLLSLLALTLYLLYVILRPFLAGIAWAVVLVVVLHPVHARLLRLLGGRHWAAGGLLTALVAAFVVVPVAIAVTQLADGLARSYQWLSQQIGSDGALFEGVERIPWIGAAVDWVRERGVLEQIDLRAMILSAVKAVGGAAAGQAGALATNALQAFLTAAVLLISTFVLLKEWPRLVGVLRDLLPLAPQDRDEVLALLLNVTRSVFLGVFGTAFVQGVLGAIGFALVGIPNVIMFGALTMLAALIPAGPVLVWAGGALWLFSTGSTGKALFLTLWGIVMVSSSDNLLRSILIGRGAKIPLVLVFFGTVGGLLAWGLIGLFVGPLVIMVFQFLLEVVRRDFFRQPASPRRDEAQGSGA